MPIMKLITEAFLLLMIDDKALSLMMMLYALTNLRRLLHAFLSCLYNGSIIFIAQKFSYFYNMALR